MATQNRTIALVTGAGSGIGYATALALAADGYRVALVDKYPQVIDRLAASRPDDFAAFVVDLADRSACEDLVRRVDSQLGLVGVLVMSAGVYETSGWDGLSLDEWELTHAVNLRSNFQLAQAVLPGMRQAGRGRVVMLTSLAADTGGAAAGPAYVSSKAGIIGLTRSLALTAGPFGITVNAVSPGFIVTPMTARLDPGEMAAVAERTPLRRLGTPEDIAGVITSLVSDAFSFVTGQVIAVNGGLFPH
jgi:NAD(P)-dependent dehydrogenase (short-subunit alcohol dehydrogenase family)